MTEHYEPKSELRDGVRIDWDVRITMSDGVSLAADVFRPDDDEPHPVLLAASPYGKGLPFAEGFASQFAALLGDHPEVAEQSSNAYQVWEYPDPERWVPHGYACVRIDTRGMGGSEGAIDFFSPREAQDLYECIEWAGVQPWSNGNVGMLGISYLASNQWQAAELAPPHLKAICPWEGASDFFREYTHHGGIPSEFMPTWMPYQVTRVQHGRTEAPLNPHTGRRVSGKPVRSEEELAANAIPIADVLRANPCVNDYYRDRTAVLEKITVPVLSCANWGGMGLHSRGNFEAFARVRSEQKWLEVHGLEHWTEFCSGGSSTTSSRARTTGGVSSRRSSSRCAPRTASSSATSRSGRWRAPSGSGCTSTSTRTVWPSNRRVGSSGRSSLPVRKG
jgi:putative CocE/NonD family hydrolase